MNKLNDQNKMIFIQEYGYENVAYNSEAISSRLYTC